MNTQNWFDTAFYHILYKNRDYKEAKNFMDNLLAYLSLSPQSKILDLACGRGRHSVYLNALGYQVVGIDSSANSIAYAKHYENATLQFLEHDMRVPINLKFDAVFNLFTSFGYFPKLEDNHAVIKNITSSLKEQGVGVIDFMNINYVIDHLVAQEVKVVDGIEFQLERYLEGEMLVKSIRFGHNGQDYEFLEHVRLLTLDHFKSYFEGCCASISQVFGDYRLNPFDDRHSDRLILVFKR